ncbi:3-phosphoshikimate 1-carboxyvinyltransferase [Candidatus Methylacidithermus pantelleriae]|uniref:Multifunctional fusion protein n=1 Tax=Candidatus Methylacidithermus pantelleriae TaxID=2744239 RepID=A0A8J2BQF7_9BACT|nr:3-phosphoshikimate 1-carboxyvinyltransferase [Candidatus Methylacidithermus pantelleriae]CAF0703645.1 3-phosphoshikimate 1-carboxyvinyltransferase,Cytidylate kinase [Candidatus Methylacidithermus pantelleriae]
MPDTSSRSLRIFPSRRIRGTVTVPGDKSITHRALLLATLAEGESRLSGVLTGEDCLATIRACQALGAEIEFLNATTVRVKGRDRKLLAPAEPIDCGNSGTLMRLIAGILAGQPFSSCLIGDASLSRRPMARILVPLRQMGARIDAKGPGELPPLEIHGSQLHGIDYRLPLPSAQVKSCLLLAGLFASGVTRLQEPIPTRDHTERLLRHFGLWPIFDNGQLVVHGGVRLHGHDLFIPGDFSSAAFWIVAAAAFPGSELFVQGVGLNPSRTGLLKILLRMGATVKETIESCETEPYGTLEIRGERLRGTRIRGEEIAQVIDELPILAVAGALAQGETIIRDASELRVKESDRLAALAYNLRAFGVPVEELPDGLIIEGGHPLRAASVQSFGDHRIAMAFAILALAADGVSVIEDTACIATSYPGFEKDFESLTQSEIPGWGERAFRQIGHRWARWAKESLEDPAEARFPVVAIDGTAASGKTTVAQELARRLDFAYCSTGVLYRAMTWKLLQMGVDISNRFRVARAVGKIPMDCWIENHQLKIRVGDEDPSPYLRDPEVNANVSLVASIPAVRRYLLPLQRKLARQAPLVMEGRDIGTVVFPKTPYKFFLDADPLVRQERRRQQGETDLLLERDQKDRERKLAPLKPAHDAVILDTTRTTVNELVETILRHLKRKGMNLQ